MVKWMANDMRVADIREYFTQQLAQKQFTKSRDGSLTIEMFGASFIADEPSIFGTPNQKYINAELLWYKSESTNINDIEMFYHCVPQAWKYSANAHGEINSNYGHLIWSKKYHEQYSNALSELKSNSDSRRATMVYTRPSIWQEYNENGKSDFICTNAVTYYIRDSRLYAVVQMRSNDIVYGYNNDYAWQRHVQEMLSTELNVKAGKMVWQVQNLHCYERHFNLIDPGFSHE